MELLHGKAKEEFFEWLDKQDLAPYRVMFDEVPLIVQTSYIIEWLDSNGLKIGIEPLIDSSFRSFVLGYDNLHHWIDNRFDSRKEATIEAIKMAVEIYNEKHI